jgi:hypothetical protein
MASNVTHPYNWPFTCYNSLAVCSLFVASIVRCFVQLYLSPLALMFSIRGSMEEISGERVTCPMITGQCLCDNSIPLFRPQYNMNMCQENLQFSLRLLANVKINLLGCDAMQPGRLIQTCWRKLLISSKWRQKSHPKHWYMSTELHSMKKCNITVSRVLSQI